jgi:hypothetical protein
VIPEDGSPSGTSISAHVAMLFLDDTVVFNDPNLGESCVQLYGYHFFNTTLLSAPFYYGVVAPMTDACVAGDPYMSPVSQLDRLTRVTSHELGERPPTYRQGGEIVRKPSEVLQYTRRIMGGFAYQQIHGQIPDLLREMAQAMDRSTKRRQAAARAGHKPVVHKLG